MDAITKQLKKLTPKERKLFKQLLEQIQKDNLQGLDVRRLKGHTNIYRVRKGMYRVIFFRKGKSISILAFEKRSDRTYSKY